VIDDLDETLRAFLGEMLPPGTPCDFDPPTPEWSEPVKEVTANLFLHDVRENHEGQASGWADVRDAAGAVVGFQPPVRRYDFTYLFTVWGASTVEQHLVLGAVLTGLPHHSGIAPAYLAGRLADQGLAVGFRLQAGGAAADLWSSLHQPARSSLTLLLTAPVVPTLVTEVAPAATSVDLGLEGLARGPVRPPAGIPATSGDQGPPPERRNGDGRPRRWAAHRIREQPGPLASRTESSSPPPQDPPTPSSTRIPR
jgi:hypothetical protein